MDSRELFDAIVGGDLGAVLAGLGADPALANATLDPQAAPGHVEGYSALHAAARAGRVAVAAALIDAGADLERRATNGRESRTALHDSFEFGQSAVTELLLERGATLDVCTAAGLGRCDRLHDLLDADPQLADDEASGLPPLGWAAYGNQVAAIELLLDRGAALGEALACCAQCGHAEAAGALLARGADPNQAGEDGATPLHHAAAMRYAFGAAEVVELLLAAGADPEALMDGDMTPLDVARHMADRRDVPRAKRRGYEAVIALLEAVG